MREIKFRAWSLVNKNMSPTGSFSDWMKAGITEHFRTEENPNAVLMQYTGIKDKNGKEIYEGDILQTPPLFEGDKSYFEIYWGKEKNDYTGGMWGWKAKSSVSDGIFDESIRDKGEVVGNIYENPELLK